MLNQELLSHAKCCGCVQNEYKNQFTHNLVTHKNNNILLQRNGSYPREYQQSWYKIEQIWLTVQETWEYNKCNTKEQVWKFLNKISLKNCQKFVCQQINLHVTMHTIYKSIVPTQCACKWHLTRHLLHATSACNLSQKYCPAHGLVHKCVKWNGSHWLPKNNVHMVYITNQSPVLTM